MTNQDALFPEFTPPAPAAEPQTETKPGRYTGGKIIYETAGKAREYRELAANLFTGCDHGCTYCYAPNVLQRNRQEFHGTVKPRTDIIRLLGKDAEKCRQHGETRQVLLCFTCDPYSPAASQTPVTRQAIQVLHAAGLHVCTLTKGGTRALRDLDLFTVADSFATTLTSLDDATSLRWEPGAALPADRIEALRRFHAAGIPTWVSLEPVLDPDETMEIICRTADAVDEFKVGVLNYHPRAREIDWYRFAREVVGLLESLGKKHYIKQDLRKYLADRE